MLRAPSSNALWVFVPSCQSKGFDRIEEGVHTRPAALTNREKLACMTLSAARPEAKQNPRHSNGYYVGLAFMGLFYIASGINHFRSPQTYLPVMPQYIPSPLLMIYISGAAEILGGIGVLVPNGFAFPRTRAFAGWGLVALLIAVSPVHINMCLHPENFPQIPLWAIWLRLPLQLPLIAWAWYYTRP